MTIAGTTSAQDAAAFGFVPEATGVANRDALQRAVDAGGTIAVTRPGTYKLAGTVYLPGRTTLAFGNNTFVQKVDERGPFTHVFLNKGALTRTWDEGITIDGLHLLVNKVDIRKWEIFGLHGHVAFMYVRNLRLRGFRCTDLGAMQYAVHICTFEDLLVEDVMIKGLKDGIHLGRGKRFTIRRGVFQTFDDAIALNAHDWDVGNPELGWIEHGVIEDCHDLHADETTGYFCRMISGAWVDWWPGMELQKSDTVVSNGRLYRVRAEADGKVYRSLKPPTHDSGTREIDGITWQHVQNDVVYTAGVRNVVFRDIVLEKPRTFVVNFESDKYCRSYYPGADVPMAQHLVFDNVRMLQQVPSAFLAITAPVDAVTITNSRIGRMGVWCGRHSTLPDHGSTSITFIGCTFTATGDFALLLNAVDGKHFNVRTVGSIQLHQDLQAKVVDGKGMVHVRSDLTGFSNLPGFTGDAGAI